MPVNEDQIKLRIALKALERIRDFGHAYGCDSCAPIYECGCYDKSQWTLAEDALNKIKNLKIKL